MSQLSAPTNIAAQGLFATATTPQGHVLGERMSTPDGREFVYCLSGASAITQGTLVQSPATVANHQNMAVVNNQAIGDLTITVTLGATAATANQYSGGYLVINAGTGIGQTLRIKSHPAAASSANLVLTLEDPFYVAITSASSKASLTINPFNGVITNPTTPTGTVIGAALVAIPATSYAWLQTLGPVALLGDSSVPTSVGAAVAPSTTTAGTVTVGSATAFEVGQTLEVGASGEARTVQLALN